MFRKPMICMFCTAAIGTIGFLSARTAEAKDPEVKDGIAGKVVKVDATNNTITIADQNDRERTYSVTEETTIVGPRGGVVRRRLKDPRFHSGLSITVVADGKAAAELHLGYDRKAREGSETATPTRTRRTTTPSTTDTNTNDSGTSTPSTTTPSTSTTRTSRFRGTDSGRATGKNAAKEEDEDDDNEFPGKVKSVEPSRHMLVITLVNGKDRSFLLAHDVKVLVNNRESREGLSDASIKPGMSVTVITEAGGRKVKEVKFHAGLLRRLRKAA
jgi:hypothetical protein